MPFHIPALLLLGKGLGIKGLLVKMGFISKATVSSTSLLNIAAGVTAIGAGAAAYAYLKPKAVSAINKKLKELQLGFQITEQQLTTAQICMDSIAESNSVPDSLQNLTFNSVEELLQYFLVKECNWNEYLAAAVTAAYLYWVELIYEDQNQRLPQYR